MPWSKIFLQTNRDFDEKLWKIIPKCLEIYDCQLYLTFLCISSTIFLRTEVQQVLTLQSLVIMLRISLERATHWWWLYHFILKNTSEKQCNLLLRLPYYFFNFFICHVRYLEVVDCRGIKTNGVQYGVIENNVVFVRLWPFAEFMSQSIFFFCNMLYLGHFDPL